MNIRPYRNCDFNEIVSWWKAYGEPPPIEGMMVEHGTFILDIAGTSALCLTVLFTQSEEIAYLEGFIKNPLFKQDLTEFGKQLWNYCFNYAKSHGYKRVICFCAEPKLEKKYETFGMVKTMSGLSSFTRRI